MIQRITRILFCCFAFQCVVIQVDAESPLQVEWTSFVGTNAIDHSKSIVVNSSDEIYVSGFYSSPFTVLIPTTATLRKFSSSGSELWFREDVITSSSSGSVAINSLGNPLTAVQRTTHQNYPGFPYSFLRSYDDTGNVIDSTEIGSPSSSFESAYDLALDGNDNAYITGTTSGDFGGISAGGKDAFLMKLDNSGNQIWVKQFGTSEQETSNAVAIDSTGSVYITGETEGDLGGVNLGNEDVFLRKYDSSGNLLWSTQTGTSASEMSKSVAVDSLGNAYITGYTEGDLGGVNAGYGDAFLSKYDSQGNHAWTKQFGTESTDKSNSVAIDSADDVYITGSSNGDLSGSNSGGFGVFLSKFDGSGDMLWTQQVGGVGIRSNALAIDGSGDVYITGDAGFSVFLTKFSSLPLQGDFNRDGTVDAADYTTWRDGVGTIYDPSDYGDWVSNYGNSLAETESSSNAVPEPSTILLFFVTVGMLEFGRSGRQ